MNNRVRAQEPTPLKASTLEIGRILAASCVPRSRCVDLCRIGDRAPVLFEMCAEILETL